MRVIADTNIIVSAIFFEGKPREFLLEWFNNKFDLICSEEIYQEYIATIKRISEKYKDEVNKEILSVLHDKLVFVQNLYKDSYSRDPDDDKFINCARSAGIDFLVTGDKDLLILREVDQIKIITVSEFLHHIVIN